MGRNKKKNIVQVTSNSNSDLIKDISSLSISELKSLNDVIPNYLYSKLYKSVNSDNIVEAIKAQSVLDEIQKSKKEEGSVKSVFFDPNNITGNGRGYKDSLYGVSFDVLQRMGETFIVKAIVNTRIEQVQNFLRFSNDEQKEGFTIRKKKSLFSNENSEMTEDEKETATYIYNFLERGGKTSKWENTDTFQDFIRKITRDSLVLDQLAFETVRDERDFSLYKFKAVDASLIRWLDTIDPRMKAEFEKFRYKGFLPTHAMVYQNQIIRNPISDELVVYYPWELGYGIRNKTTNIYKNGYGVSELETLTEVITWILWGMQYNGNFFKQGSQPKGFINIKGSNVTNQTLNEFRQAWTQTMSSVYNAHKMPILSGIDLEWVDLQHSNKDMEFDSWVKFLIVITCAVYRIDPTELGFNFTDTSQLFGQSGQHERLQHSKQKGLKPLLVFLQYIINDYIVSEIDDRFEFAFTGIENEDEIAQVKLDAEKLKNGMVSFEDTFKKYSGRDYDPIKDTILNQVFQMAQQAKLMGGADMNSEVDMMNNDSGVGDLKDPYASDDAYSQYEKALGKNPIMKSALDYTKNILNGN